MDHGGAGSCYGHAMDTGVVAVVLLVLAAVVAVVVPYLFRAPGRALKRRFVALGTLKGKTRKEIERAADGLPHRPRVRHPRPLRRGHPRERPPGPGQGERPDELTSPGGDIVTFGS